MKKILSTLALAVFCLVAANTLQAQESKFGLRGGVNFASLSGDDDEGLDGKTGWNLGIVYDYTLNDKFAYEVGFTYSAIGASGDNDSLGIDLDYLYISLVAKYLVTENIHIRGGLQGGFLAAAESPAGEDLTEFFDGGDFGLIFGAGYKFDFGLGVNLDYQLGLSAIGAEIETFDGINSTTEEIDLSTRNLQLSFYYLF